VRPAQVHGLGAGCRAQPFPRRFVPCAGGKKYWNEAKGLCKESAPDLGVEMATAQASAYPFGTGTPARASSPPGAGSASGRRENRPGHGGADCVCQLEEGAAYRLDYMGMWDEDWQLLGQETEVSRTEGVAQAVYRGIQPSCPTGIT